VILFIVGRPNTADLQPPPTAHARHLIASRSLCVRCCAPDAHASLGPPLPHLEPRMPAHQDPPSPFSFAVEPNCANKVVVLAFFSKPHATWLPKAQTPSLHHRHARGAATPPPFARCRRVEPWLRPVPQRRRERPPAPSHAEPSRTTALNRRRTSAPAATSRTFAR
jgi:hypothetical protein